MEFESRIVESWWMWSAAVRPRAGSLVGSAVASEDADTPRQCPPGPWVLASMHHLGPVVLVADSGAMAAEVSAEAAVATVSDLVEESAIREVVVGLVDRHPRMLPLAQVVDVAEEEDSTVVVLAATESLCAPAIAMRTVTAATTAIAMVVTGPGTVTAWETATETATATVTATGLAAGRTMDASDTVRMMVATMTRAPADDTKRSYFPFLPMGATFSPFSTLT